MKIGEILSLATFMAGNNEFSKKITDVLNGVDYFTAEEDDEVKKLLNYYYLTVTEINDSYLPLLYKEAVTFSDNKFYYKDFSKIPLEIKKVEKSLYGSVIPVKHKIYPTYLYCEEPNCSVTYNYRVTMPSSIEDECVYSGSVITDRVIAEGVVSVIFNNLAMYQEYVLWREKYEHSLKSCILKRKTQKIKARGWY